MKKVKTLWLFLMSSFFILFLLFLSDFYLNTKELIHNFYSEQLSEENIIEIAIIQDKWAWLNYAIIPLIILIRITLVSLCLSIGVFFYDMDRKIPFNQFLRIALIGEFVLIFVSLVKLLYFLFIKTDYTLQDLQQYYPLSYINFLDIEKLQPWLVYPLQTINLFELAYFLVLVYGLYKLLKNKFWKSFEITAVSYGTGLVIWIGLVMFLTLNIS